MNLVQWSAAARAAGKQAENEATGAFFFIIPRLLAGRGSAIEWRSHPWRYRLTVRTEPSQGLNTGSIPVSATKPFKINHLQNRRTEPMYKRYNGLRGNSYVNPLSPPLRKMPRSQA